ncbi:hypothetical protein OPV22_000072 [Ensete ventricosum]|uniref:Uncharacterized protein n=1 Tax=Ensete ventricosum TaxID=4639 RepID=A0AAV8RUQ0_ENSVE|nr:hypothetical protein OPV22_000072 [Ensete ventricosum]
MRVRVRASFKWTILNTTPPSSMYLLLHSAQRFVGKASDLQLVQLSIRNELGGESGVCDDQPRCKAPEESSMENPNKD